MKNMTHLTRRTGLLTLLIALASPMIEAADKTPIRMIVPASAGSGLDITLRAAAGVIYTDQNGKTQRGIHGAALPYTCSITMLLISLATSSKRSAIRR